MFMKYFKTAYELIEASKCNKKKNAKTGCYIFERVLKLNEIKKLWKYHETFKKTNKKFHK